MDQKAMETARKLPVDVVRREEPATEVFLADGSKITMRTTVMDVRRIEGQFDAEGNPAYYVRHNVNFVVTAPEGMKRKA